MVILSMTANLLFTAIKAARPAPCIAATREELLNQFEFDAHGKITKEADASFRLWDEKQWLQTNFHGRAMKVPICNYG